MIVRLMVWHEYSLVITAVGKRWLEVESKVMIKLSAFDSVTQQ